MCLYSLLVAQNVEKQIIIKKSDHTTDANTWVEKEKIVSVDVSKDDSGQRRVKVLMDSDGQENVYQWTDDGEIPDDVKQNLEEAGIDLHILKSSDDNHSDGRAIEIEWNGEGDMPQELMQFKEKHGIDLSEYLSDEEMDSNKRIIMVEKQMTTTDEAPTIRKRTKTSNRYKTITIDADGNQNVMEWEDDGSNMDGLHKSHGMKKRHKMQGAQGQVLFVSNEDKVQVSDAYMGAQIESVDNGAVILDLMKDSPADKAKLKKGDIITKINGARTRTMEALLTLLNYYEPADQVEVSILRDGKEKSLKMTLGERPEYYR